MQEHLIKIEEHMEQLSIINSNILSDHLCVALLLSSVPESYGPLIMSLSGQPDTEITQQQVRDKHLEEAERREQNDGMETSTETVRKSTAALPRRNNPAGQVECFFCKGAGHMKKQCKKYATWIKGKETKENKKKKYGKHSVKKCNQHSDESDDEDDEHQSMSEEAHVCLKAGTQELEMGA